MAFLNPYSTVVTEMAKKAHESGRKKTLEALAAKRGFSKSMSKDQKVEQRKHKKNSKSWITTVLKNIDESVSRDIAALKKEDTANL